MKIRFLEDTYIRKMPRVENNQPVGTVFQGSEIEVEPDTVRGDPVQHTDRWYCDKNGWYYWSGKTEPVEEEPAPPPGDTHGGIMIWPATTTPDSGDEIPPRDEIPPQANDDTGMSSETIPEGETRLVPSLEELMAREERSRAGALTAPPPKPGLTAEAPARPEPAAAPIHGFDLPPLPETELESARPPAHIRTTAPPPEEDRPAADAPADALWRNPAPQNLNWGVRNYLIAKDWWQQRQLTGKGVRVAILSTGAAQGHPDLVHLREFFPGQERAEPLQDRHGLGTQAAVVAVGAGNTVFGVAPEAQLLVGKLGEQDHLLSPDGLIQALRWAIDAGADVIAMLVDFPDLDVRQLEALQILVNDAIARGILLVAPAGTSENKKPESRYPARLTGVLSVGAHDKYGQRSGFSARSYDLDLLAPGEALLTSTPEQQPVNNLKSTAIAAAFTAGFLALVRQWYREQQLEVQPGEIFDLLRRTAVARRSFNKGEDVEFGYGILNPIDVLKALDPDYRGPGPD